VKPAIAVAAVLALFAPASASAELAIGSRSAEDGWAVMVSAKAVGLGPIDVSVGPFRPATGWGNRWLEHDLVLTNTGDRPVTFADTWTVAVLGPPGRPMLIAEADGRCGYRAVRPLRVACILPLIFVGIRPGRSETRVATLWKGVRRMAPLEPGTYVFRQPLRYRLDRHVPTAGEGRTGAIKLVYRVEADAGA
jgi:hypothetical protein